jgi:ABC-type proline/glycine betaine transport system substrate-binding protein
MNFVEHNLKISPINYSFSSIYRLDQMHGPEDNPSVSTVFLTDDDIKGLVQSWLKNSNENVKRWLNVLE